MRIVELLFLVNPDRKRMKLFYRLLDPVLCGGDSLAALSTFALGIII